MDLNIKKLQTFLQNNNFYRYSENFSQLSEGYRKDYLQTTEPTNKRNLIFHKSWNELHSFGKPRQVIIMELGGSYFKLFKAEVVNEKKVVTLKNQAYQFYENKVYTPEILFTDIKKQLDAFLDDEDKQTIRNIVFIFAFPIEQYTRTDNYIDAICVAINKNHRSEGIVGLKIGESLQEFLRQRGYPNINISVTNDTPASLLSAKAIEITQKHRFDGIINIIVGTGTNIAVGQDIELEGQKRFKIINTEFGNFKSAPLSTFDQLLNDSLESKNQYLTEKMISGAWTHLLFRIIINKALQAQLLDQKEINEYDLHNMDSGEIERFLKNPPSESPTMKSLQLFWQEITKRGATICGITLAAIMTDLYEKLNLSEINIGIIQVGSVIEKAQSFKQVIIETINSEFKRCGLSEKIHFEFFNPHFQTVLGSTIFDSFFLE